MIIDYPGLTITPIGSTLLLNLDAYNSDDPSTPRQTSHVVHEVPEDPTERVEAVYKAVCELAQHEVAEWFRVDGKRWRAPHPEQPTHHSRIFLKARDYSVLRSCCLMLLDFFACPVEVLLVGSALERSNYNDIDVRFIISHEKYQDLALHPRGLSSLMTEFIRSITRLQVDIQIQDENETYEGRPSVNIINYRGAQ